jgi:hypothetical protein
MRTLCLPFLAVMLLSSMAQPAAAVLQFYKVFQTEYLDKHPDQEFATLAKKNANRCFICHRGKKRTHRNEFGAHLDEMLEWKQDAKDKEKIAAALKEVVALHVDSNDDKSETYADRIAASKFPGGELEEMKKEPEE